VGRHHRAEKPTNRPVIEIFSTFCAPDICARYYG
jgi:hypothetical protein